ncbi:MAG: hypothetical protein MR346_13475 [Clostridium sp.]|nr:hypothetical protein [Peptostreptococcaceae bacterium]MCI5630618.1 hypothetical protein [Clostridium sp.]
MIQELSKLQCLKTYKKVKITFLKDETNEYIENLQMLIFLEGFEKPVYATKLNAFEFYEATVYDRERTWANIPFIYNKITSRKVQKIKLKDSELNKLRKFLARFNLRTVNLIFGEVMSSLNKLDGSKFSNKPQKKVREKVQIVLP